ncbi:MAG: ATP-grasp domain-containing protein [Planctomycetota bacterium]|jgi:carbamoyl-phosphate synthase large subunit
MVEKNKKNCKSFNVLFTCIGRRVSLLNAFREAAKAVKLKCRFFGTDITPLSPALQLCDEKFVVKAVTHQGYIRQLLKIVRNHSVKLLVPTVDLDLKDLAANREKFEKLGCRILVSSPRVVDICQDKRKTFRFLRKNNFSTPETMTARKILDQNKINFPLFLKPWDGYASRGNEIVKNRKELAFYAKKIPNCIAQEYIEGEEYTCDCFVDLDGEVRCVVPRRRIEVRSGEVSKAEIVKNRYIMNKTAEVVKTLNAGPGVITVQLILTRDKQIEFIEINPRFGGGVPLAIKAGANFPKWILSLMAEKKPVIRFDRFKDKLIMLRYDAEVWKSS